MTKVISKDNLVSWLKRLIGERVVIAPASSEGLFLFKSLSRVEELVLDFDQTVLSAKDAFLRASEVLFVAEEEDGQTKLVPTSVDEEVVLFGIHPCDAKGIALIDKPLLQAPADDLYRQHRDSERLRQLLSPQPKKNRSAS